MIDKFGASVGTSIQLAATAEPLHFDWLEEEKRSNINKKLMLTSPAASWQGVQEDRDQDQAENEQQEA